MNNLPGLTQCAANCNLPINDCNCLFVAFVLCNHTFTKSIISLSFSYGTEIVISMVLNFDPKNTIICEGATALSSDSAIPSCFSKLRI